MAPKVDYGIKVDQGWSWVVLVAVFLTTFLCSIPYMAGLFTVQFAQEFGLDASVTSICGSLVNAMFCFSGKIYE